MGLDANPHIKCCLCAYTLNGEQVVTSTYIGAEPLYQLDSGYYEDSDIDFDDFGFDDFDGAA